MRDLILKRVAALNLSRYDLANAVKGKVSSQAVYDYLAGRRDMTSGFVWHLLKALDLEIRPRK